MRNIKTVTVVGANGTMGTNVSGIFASFGAAKVIFGSSYVQLKNTLYRTKCR